MIKVQLTDPIWATTFIWIMICTKNHHEKWDYSTYVVPMHNGFASHLSCIIYTRIFSIV